MSNAVLLFDGVCNLCNWAVRFILKNEKDHLIKFASLQSEPGKKILFENHIPFPGPESIIFIENGKVYSKSEAILFVVRHLKSPWHLLSGLRIFPVSFRDGLYDLIARNRYKVFGKKENCPLPEKKWETRFL